jgi:hypothetical protein
VAIAVRLLRALHPGVPEKAETVPRAALYDQRDEIREAAATVLSSG